MGDTKVLIRIDKMDIKNGGNIEKLKNEVQTRKIKALDLEDIKVEYDMKGINDEKNIEKLRNLIKKNGEYTEEIGYDRVCFTNITLNGLWATYSRSPGTGYINIAYGYKINGRMNGNCLVLNSDRREIQVFKDDRVEKVIKVNMKGPIWVNDVRTVKPIYEIPISFDELKPEDPFNA